MTAPMRRTTVLALSVLLAACATAPSHVVDPQIVPLFQKRGDARLNVLVTDHPFIQVGNALTDRLGLIAAAAYSQRREDCPSCDMYVRRHIEIGLGGYRQRAERQSLEFFAGAGAGRFATDGFNVDYDANPASLVVTSGKYTQAFLQVDGGLVGRVVERAAAVRLTAYRFTDFRKRDGNGNTIPVPDAQFGLFLEPTMVYRLGVARIKGEIQLRLTAPLVEAEGMNSDIVRLSLALGIQTPREGRRP